MALCSMGYGYEYSHYTWYTYNGHQYAVTMEYSNWADAEAEAAALGGHLVTINDAAENTWLTNNFGGYYTYEHRDTHFTWESLIWIGLEHIGGDMTDPASWQWVSGEPKTYMAPWWASPVGGAGVHAYLHTSTHPNPGTWWNSDHDSDPDNHPRGIIELSEPACEPLAYWSFDNAGDPGHDDSGNGNDGTVSGATWTSDGKLAGALEFDGQSSKVIVPDSASFSQISANKMVSLEAWFIVTSLPYDHNPIVAKWGGGADSDDEWKLDIRGNVGTWYYGRIMLDLNSSTVHGSPNTSLISSIAPSWGVWHHVVATWDGNAGEAALYLDGIEVASSNSAISTIPNTSQQVTIGYAHIASGAYKYFYGKIDEVKIYDCEFSPEPPCEPHTMSWERVSDNPTPRRILDAAYLNGKVYVIAGETSSHYGYSKDVLCYDPIADNWQTLAPLPTARSWHQSVAYNGEIWVISGTTTGNVGVSSVDIYDPASNTWRSGPSLNRVRSGHGAVVVGDKIYVMNGEATGTMEIYNSGFGWELSPHLMSEAGVGSAVALGTDIYFLHDDGAVEIYDTEVDSWRLGPPVSSTPVEVGQWFYGFNLMGQLYALSSTPQSGKIPRLYWLNQSAGEWQETQTVSELYPKGAYAVAEIGSDQVFVTGGELRPAITTSEYSWIGTLCEPPCEPPVADADGPYIASAVNWDGATVLLDGTASYDPDGVILEYQWDLDLQYDSDLDGDPTNDIDEAGPTPEVLFPIGQKDISLVVIDDCGVSSEPDVTTVTVSVIEAAIDIKPGSFPNAINMGSRGVIPVAFLTDPAFDASTIDPATVTLRGEDFADGLVKLRGKKDAPVPMANLEDVDGDGDLDLVVHLETEKLAEHELDAICEIGGLTYDGYVVSGTDTIQIVPE